MVDPRAEASSPTDQVVADFREGLLDAYRNDLQTLQKTPRDPEQVFDREILQLWGLAGQYGVDFSEFCKPVPGEYEQVFARATGAGENFAVTHVRCRAKWTLELLGEREGTWIPHFTPAGALLLSRSIRAALMERMESFLGRFAREAV